jgi:hypothetical protein
LKDKTFSAIQAIMVFSLEKRSVAWVVVGNVRRIFNLKYKFKFRRIRALSKWVIIY